LSTLARDVLAIPISTVASESAFSTSGRILDDFRSSLTPFMVQALVCTQDWLRRKTVNVVEDTEALTKLEEGNYLVYYLISVPFTCCFYLFALKLDSLFLFSEIIQEFKDKVIIEAHAAKSTIQGSKKRWLHPPTLAPNQSLPRQTNPQMKAKTRTHLNDHVS
jgi:hypothetical protein